MPSKKRIIHAIERLGYTDVRLYPGVETTTRWAAIRPYAGGFGIGMGDLHYIHNEIWWFETLATAQTALEAWDTGRGSPPMTGRKGPRQITTRKGKLRRWTIDD